MSCNISITMRKLTAVVLVIMSVCMMMSAQAETMAADTIFGERNWRKSTRGRRKPCPMHWTIWLTGISVS